jgi:hypothetical protein
MFIKDMNDIEESLPPMLELKEVHKMRLTWPKEHDYSRFFDMKDPTITTYDPNLANRKS